MATAVKLHIDGTAYPVSFDDTRSPYDVSREMLGDWTEQVNILQVGDHMLTMWVDEQGHLKNLPLNPLASKFYPAPGRGTPGNPPIVGDVVFVLMKLVPGPDWKAIDMNTDALKALQVQGVEF